MEKNQLEFINSSIDLSFEINMYESPLPPNVILMDFMESFDVADIFTIQLD